MTRLKRGIADTQGTPPEAASGGHRADCFIKQ